MFKLVVLAIILSVVTANPGGLYAQSQDFAKTYKYGPPVDGSAIIIDAAPAELHQPFITKVGAHIDKIPNAVSHQRTTTYHGRTNKITPILNEGIETYQVPAVKHITSPISNMYAKSNAFYGGIQGYSSPSLHSYASPAIHTYSTPSIAVKSYNPYNIGTGFGAPVKEYLRSIPHTVYGVPAVTRSYSNPAVTQIFSDYIQSAPGVYTTSNDLSIYSGHNGFQNAYADFPVHSYTPIPATHSFPDPGTLQSYAVPLVNAYTAPAIKTLGYAPQERTYSQHISKSVDRTW